MGGGNAGRHQIIARPIVPRAKYSSHQIAGLIPRLIDASTIALKAGSDELFAYSRVQIVRFADQLLGDVKTPQKFQIRFNRGPQKMG